MESPFFIATGWPNPSLASMSFHFFFGFNAFQGPLLRARTRVARCSRHGHGTGRGGPRVGGGEEGLGPSCCSASVIMGLPWDYSGLMGCHVHVYDN
jgi:hypothetical protein